MNFTETDEQTALRAAVAELGAKYGYTYFTNKAEAGGGSPSSGPETAKLGSIGVNLPEVRRRRCRHVRAGHRA